MVRDPIGIRVTGPLGRDRAGALGAARSNVSLEGGAVLFPRETDEIAPIRVDTLELAGRAGTISGILHTDYASVQAAAISWTLLALHGYKNNQRPQHGHQ